VGVSVTEQRETARTDAGRPIVGTAGFDDVLTRLEWHRSSNVEQRLADARRLAHEALTNGDDLSLMRARLVEADMLHRVGSTDEGARLAVEVHAWAETHGARPLLARSHLVLSSMFEGIGDRAASLDHAVRATALLDEHDPPRMRGIHLLRLADALAFDGSVAPAQQRYEAARALFESIGDRERVLNVLNNLAVLASETGDPAASSAAADVLERYVTAAEMCFDYAETIARARLVAGDLAGAEEAILVAADLFDVEGGTKAVAPAEIWLTRAEILLAQQRLDEAQVSLDRCREVCDRRHLSGVAVAALDVQSQVDAATGDHETAYRRLREAQSAAAALRSQQRESAALTREALLRTDQAHRDAERFRQLARLDPLTELHNRRVVDEVLPRWLAEQHTHGAVVAAMIDVDHFKLINDRWSHRVGDEVLRRLGRVLAAHVDAAPEARLAARVGGEEFVVLDRSLEPGEAVRRLEALRATIADAGWSEVADGLRPTVSVGVAVSTDVDAPAALLERADHQLYRAKAAGRDVLLAAWPV
jgi:diguanylate cyclase (GGDEF)-like protein